MAVQGKAHSMTSRHQLEQVVVGGICTGCGACAAVSGEIVMQDTPGGPQPRFLSHQPIPDLAFEACPGKGIDYPSLYRSHYGRLPEDWRVGTVDGMWTGYAGDPDIRRAGASGGVTTAVLIHLLETRRIDAAVIARQGVPSPEKAGYHIARTREEILDCAQSVYIPVSMLDALREFKPGERYAMTCVPEQSAALRVLQQAGHEAALQVGYVLGPYTGTALYPGAIRTLLRSHGVRDEDAVASLKWRAGEWPGYLEVITASGRVVRSKKVYYNFLIPFFVTQTSLQSMDFANEFTDLSVGDAWSPKHEALGAGFSVVTSRTPAMTALLEEMRGRRLLVLEPVDPLEASSMHGHMIDFKKRGGHLRNQWRRLLGRAAPDYGLHPVGTSPGRYLVEVVVSGLFAIAGTAAARRALQLIPEKVIGPVFNWLRLNWKAMSKPTKRKGLRNLQMRCAAPAWRTQSS